MSWVSAVMTATDYVETKLKARYIGKADYLIEFDNIKDKYIMANMKADPIAVKESLAELEQEKPLLKKHQWGLSPDRSESQNITQNTLLAICW